MEEHKKERIEEIGEKEACVKLEDASYTWGFRVKENQSQMKKQNKARLDLEMDDLPVLSDINLDLKHDSLLVVVGRIGSGKTTLLYSIMEETVRK